MVYFQTKISTLEGLGMKKVGVFYGHLEYTYYDDLVYFVAIR
jgi:hypothetical protein